MCLHLAVTWWHHQEDLLSPQAINEGSRQVTRPWRPAPTHWLAQTAWANDKLRGSEQLLRTWRFMQVYMHTNQLKFWSGAVPIFLPGLHSHWPQHSMPDWGKGVLHCACAIQTIWQGRGSGSRTRGSWRGMASTSRRACRRPRQAYRMLRYWIRHRSNISYVFGDVCQRHRNLTYEIV